MKEKAKSTDEEELNELDETEQEERRLELLKILKGKNLAIIDHGYGRHMFKNIFILSYEINDLITRDFAPKDLISWITEAAPDAFLIHAQSLQELDQVVEMHEKGIKVGVLLRGRDGAHVEGYFDKIDELVTLKVPLFNKTFDIAQIAEAFAKVIDPKNNCI